MVHRLVIGFIWTIAFLWVTWLLYLAFFIPDGPIVPCGPNFCGRSTLHTRAEYEDFAQWKGMARYIGALMVAGYMAYPCLRLPRPAE